MGSASVSAGPNHVAFVKADGTVWSWGRNAEGELGDGTNTDRNVPVHIPTLSNAVSVKAGGYHTLALLNDGTVLAWGEDYYGQLGDGATDDLASPVAVTGLTNVTKIAAGDQRSVALKQDGTAWTWGFDYYEWQTGQDHYQLTPTQVDGLTDVVDVAAGVDHVVAVKSDGTVWAWGTSWNNELGIGGPSGQHHATPVQVPGLPAIIAVASQYDHTLALASDGTVWAWGRNNWGQLGNGTTSPQSAPVQVSNLTEVIAIAASRGYSMAMKSDGTIWLWGEGGTNLGIVGILPSSIPQQAVLGLLDGNANGMEDRWEWDYFGNLDQTAEGDFDGDGISNLSEYQGHSDPTDYYNGSLPALSIIGGDNQTADPEVFLPDPLVVRVVNQQGQPLSNAPVTFTNGDGSFAVTNDGNAPLEYSLTVRTDLSGLATVYYYTPPIVNFSATITATAQTDAGSVSIQFAEMTDTPPPPPAPSDVAIQKQSDGSQIITWVSHSTNEDGFVVERQNLDNSWSQIGSTDPGQTSLTLPPPTRPVADTGNDRVAATKYDQRSYSEETSPAQVRYAIIDLGTNLPPVRVTNSGYVLCTDGGETKRWHNGQLETLTGGDPIDGVPYGLDINESGTVVGEVSLFSYPPLSLDNFYSSGRGVIIAAKWDAGQTGAVTMDRTFHYHFEDAQPNNQPPIVWDGIAGGSSASAVDNDGHIYGTALGGYQQREAFTDANENIHPRIWGYWGGGWDFTSGAGLGNITFGLSGDTYTFSGHDRTIQKIRNGTTFGYQTGEANGGYYHDPYIGPGYTYTSGSSPGFTFVNNQPVDFNPVNLNSYATLLCRNLPADPFRWFLFDSITNVSTELEIPPPIYFGPFPIGPFYFPAALNHRQIPAFDANGQPILDGNGQQTTKESPQLVGSDYTLSEPIAMSWEEDPKSHHYQSAYLNRLISADSGWQLEDAYDINDEGVIVADGWYQPHDAQGNPTGPRQWRSCLLWPMKTVYAFFGASAISGVPPPDPNPDANLTVLNDYLMQHQYNGDPATLDFLRTFDGTHAGAVCTFVKASPTASGVVRVFTYNCIRADRATGAVAMQAMKDALNTPGAFVTFNGHANMGAGPAFSLDVGGLSGFMHICNPIAGISGGELAEEHYNFALRSYVPGDPDNEILETASNYTVPIVQQLRFKALPGFENNGVFQLHDTGSSAYHYESDLQEEAGDPPQIRQFTLVHTSSADLPTLRYKWFFFDACNSGRDYIEVLQHGSFFYTTDLSGAFETTRNFVQGIAENRSPSDIVAKLNTYYANPNTNAFHDFNP